jgi:hypothetical protein
MGTKQTQNRDQHTGTGPAPSRRAVASAAGTAIAAALCTTGALTESARAQLRPDQVLVVYDSRIEVSGQAVGREVAAYYAGSHKVPGASQAFPGVRPGVWTLDLAQAPGAPAATQPGNVSYTNFVQRLRDPIRAYLNDNGLDRHIRCIVLTKGLPHRIQDTDNPNVGDFPNDFVNEFSVRDVTSASVDAELTLLWQDLSAGENGGPADSFADGLIVNPYWRATVPISNFITTNIRQAKALQASTGGGPLWSTSPTAQIPQRLLAGDIYLVCRLDGHTVEDVRGIIDRAQNLYVNTLTAHILLDESRSNGIADPGPNGELDNSGGAFSSLRDGDDYELTRDQVLADGRWNTANVRYNALDAFNQFFIGPRLSWQANHGIMINGQVVLLASEGLNHPGQPLLTDGTQGGRVYALSFNYAPGAIFNSIESFNGRDFGGLGVLSFSPQQQASAALGAGMTFAVANVWEPLADTIPDNRLLANNFLLGTMSWAEAAWSSIPALSWMQIAVGDPLARVQRSSEDLDGDGAVTVDDLHVWERTPADINNSGTADAADRLLLIRALRAGERNSLLTPR